MAQISALAGPDGEISLVRERPWASITFAGTRHTLELCFPGNHDVKQIDRLCVALPDHEFNLPGYFVADILMETAPGSDGEPKDQNRNGQRLKIEALTIVDPVLKDGRDSP